MTKKTYWLPQRAKIGFVLQRHCMHSNGEALETIEALKSGEYGVDIIKNVTKNAIFENLSLPFTVNHINKIGSD